MSARVRSASFMRRIRPSARWASGADVIQQPPVTSNLYAWYDASAVNGLFAANPATDGTALASWKDLSGNGRDLSQATSANQPLFRNASRNLLTYNQGATCEDGTTTGFSVPSGNETISFSTTTGVQYGAYSLSITPKGTGTDTYASVGTDAGGMRLGMVAGNTYTVVATITLASAQVGTLNAGLARRIRVMYRQGAGGYLSYYSNQADNVAGTTNLSVTFTLPADTTEAFVRLCNGSNGTGDVVYYDKVGLFAGTVSTWTPPVTLLNNQPTVQFDGNLQAMTRSSTTLAQPFTIYAVHKAESLGNTSTSADRAIVNMVNANMGVIRGGGAAPGRPYAYAGSLFPTVTGATVTNASVLSYVYDNTSQSFRVNGSAGTAANAGSGGLSGVLGIGGGGSTHSGSMGGIAAVLIYSAAHDTTTRQSIERWLGARYGITVA